MKSTEQMICKVLERDEQQVVKRNGHMGFATVQLAIKFLKIKAVL